MRRSWHKAVALLGLSCIYPSRSLYLNASRSLVPKVDVRRPMDHAPDCELIRRHLLILPLLVMRPTAAAAIVPALRDVDVGGGFDLLGNPRLAEKDVVYPMSMEGLWSCSRVVTQVDGDQFQAESAWRALGGGSLRVNKLENYSTRFIPSKVFGELTGVVNDRGYELSSRARNTNVSWNVEKPDELKFDNIRMMVVRRIVEPPSDQGFGSNELYRIDDGYVTRAVQVKRRYRRAFDANGNRVVEGLEIMKTFRVLDGVAGTEMPTSTTKSQLRLMRP